MSKSKEKEGQLNVVGEGTDMYLDGDTLFAGLWGTMLGILQLSLHLLRRQAGQLKMIYSVDL